MMTFTPLYVAPPERQRIASALGLNEQYLYQMLSGRKPAPIDRCADIERMTGGAITVEALRPDAHWIRLPDASWPHPAGRPLLDLARRQSPAAAREV